MTDPMGVYQERRVPAPAVLQPCCQPSALVHGDTRYAAAGPDTVDLYCQVHGWVTVEWHNPFDRFTRDHNVRTGCAPTLPDASAAVDLMGHLVAAGRPWVAVFWDRGWGDSGQVAEITVICDGNGQNPRAHLSAELYAELLAAGTIGPNTLRTYKARQVHDFRLQRADCTACGEAAAYCDDQRHARQVCCSSCAHPVVELTPAAVAR